MSPGNDIKPPIHPAVAFAEKSRVRLLVLAGAALLTWACLSIWLAYFARGHSYGLDLFWPRRLDEILLWTAALATIPIARYFTRSWPWYLILFLAVGSIFVVIGGLPELFEDKGRLHPLSSSDSFAIAPLGLFAVSLTYAASESTPLVDQLRLRMPQGRRLWGFLILPVVWFGFNFLWQFTPFNPIEHPHAPNPIYDVYIYLGESIFLTLFYVAVLVPIGEEILFRGLIGPYLRDALNIGWSVAISSAIFSVLHINPTYFSMNQVIYVFFLGVILAVTMFATRSIWPGIVMHAVNNGFATLGDLGL